MEDRQAQRSFQRTDSDLTGQVPDGWGRVFYEQAGYCSWPWEGISTRRRFHVFPTCQNVAESLGTARAAYPARLSRLAVQDRPRRMDL